MKRILSALCAALLVLSLAACGGKESPSSQKESRPSSTAEVIPESTPEPSSTPEESPQPPQSEEAPDPSLSESEEEQEANSRRANALFSEIGTAFSAGLSKESYSYFTCYNDGASVVLEIGVTDEAAVDAYLTAWTGTKWDKLLKVPGRVSQARQEEFAEAAGKLDLGPNVDFHVTARDGPSLTETGRIFISATVTDAEPWEDIPQEIKDLANEMGVPEDMLFYLCHASGGAVTNTVT